MTNFNPDWKMIFFMVYGFYRIHLGPPFTLNALNLVTGRGRGIIRVAACPLILKSTVETVNDAGFLWNHAWKNSIIDSPHCIHFTGRSSVAPMIMPHTLEYRINVQQILFKYWVLADLHAYFILHNSNKKTCR